MIVTYKHSTGDTVICHGLAHPGEAGYFTGPLGEELTETQWAVEPIRPIGAAASTPADRGNAWHSFPLSVERRFTTVDEAALFARAFAGQLPRPGVSLLVEADASIGADFFATAVLENLSVRRVGCSCDVSFLFRTSVPVSIIITSSTLAGGTVGVAYDQDLAATGGTSYTWSKVSGDLPTSLSLSSAGALTGTPSAAGTFTFVAKALDASGAYVVKSISVTIAAA